MIKHHKFILVVIFLATVTAIIFNKLALANPLINNPLTNGIANKVYNLNASDTPENIFIEQLGSIIFIFLSFLGIFFILLIMYGGYIWMKAQGNVQEVEKAQHIIRDAAIGLIVLVGSGGIWLVIEKYILS